MSPQDFVAFIFVAPSQGKTMKLFPTIPSAGWNGQAKPKILILVARGREGEKTRERRKRERGTEMEAHGSTSRRRDSVR